MCLQVFFILLPIFSLLVAELTYYLGRPLDGLPILTGLVCVLGSLWMLMKVGGLSPAGDVLVTLWWGSSGWV